MLLQEEAWSLGSIQLYRFAAYRSTVEVLLSYFSRAILFCYNCTDMVLASNLVALHIKRKLNKNQTKYPLTRAFYAVLFFAQMLVYSLMLHVQMYLSLIPCSPKLVIGTFVRGHNMKCEADWNWRSKTMQAKIVLWRQFSKWILNLFFLKFCADNQVTSS